jgi:hypothetical protein
VVKKVNTCAVLLLVQQVANSVLPYTVDPTQLKDATHSHLS